MKFFRRLNRKTDKETAPAPFKIRLDSHTWLLPILVFLVNLFLVAPFLKRSALELNFSSLILLLAVILGPVFFYFFVWEISHRRLTSFIACLIYTLPTLRLSQAIVFGDGPHIIALTLTPLVLIFLLRFLRQKTVNLAIVLTVGVTLIALISPFALFTLLIFIGILTYSEMLLGQGRLKFFYTFLVLVAAAGLSAFRYHPAFVIKLFQGEHGRALLTILWSLVPPSFFLVPIIGAFSFLIFDRKPVLQPIFLAGSQFFIFLLLVFVGTHVSTTYVPVPSRFLPELSLAFAFLSALILIRISEVLKTDLSQGFLIFILTFLLASIILARFHFWAIAYESGVLGAQIRLVEDGGVSQVFGGGVTILTALTLGFLKLRRLGG